MIFAIQSDTSGYLEDELYTLQKMLGEFPLSITSSFHLLGINDTESLVKEEDIPVGTIEFTRRALAHQGYTDVLRPIEVPYFLQNDRFLNREYRIVLRDELPKQGRYFIKRASSLKSSLPSVEDMGSFNREGYSKSDLFVVSGVLELESEFRVLVCNDDVVGVQYYNGDCLAFPDTAVIREAVTEIWKQRLRGKLLPRAYTLDFGVGEQGTSLIEMHNFVACGTYRYDGSDLPCMYAEGIRYERDFDQQKGVHSYLFEPEPNNKMQSNTQNNTALDEEQYMMEV